MKRIKKIFTTIISMVLVIAMLGTSCVFADEAGRTMIVVENGIEYLIDENGYRHSYYDVNGNPLSIADAMHMIKTEYPEESENALDEGMQLRSYYVEGYGITMHNRWYSYGTDVKVTPDIAGPATITYGQSTSVTWKWSVNISATLKGIAKQLLDLNFGITIENSVSSNASFGATFPVSAGEIGAVYFKPKYYNINMTLYNDGTGDTKTTTCSTAVRLSNGFADGLYHLVTWNN